MLKRVYKNIGVRNTFAKYDLDKRVLKALLFNRKVFEVDKTKKFTEKFTVEHIRLARHFYSFGRDSSLCHVQNLCVVSGRPNSTYRVFRLNRTMLKHFAQKGLLSGVRKSSW